MFANAVWMQAVVAASTPSRGLANVLLKIQQYICENEKLIVVAASTLLMSLSHTALRPVLPVFAKVRLELWSFLEADRFYFFLLF